MNHSTAASLALLIASTPLVILLYRKYTANKNVSIIPASQRSSTLAGPPIKHRRFALGKGEYYFARVALDHVNAVKIFYSIRITRVDERQDIDILTRVKNAAKLLQKLHPILRCSLVKDPASSELYFEEDDTLEIPVEERFHSSSGKVYKEEAELAPLELGKSPHKIWIIHSKTNEEFEIVLDFHHFSLDGTSLVNLMHNLLDFTFNNVSQAVTYGQWPKTQCVALEESTSHWNFKQRILEMKSSLVKLFVPLLFSTWTKVPTNGCRQTNKNRSLCLLNTLSQEETNIFLKKCKQEQVTATTLATAAYCESLALELEKLGKKQVALQVCIVADTRGLCQPSVDPSDLSIHVASFPPFITPKSWKRDQVLDLARRLRSHVQDHIGGMLSYAANMASFLASMQPGLDLCPSLVVSSWSAKSPIQPLYCQHYQICGGELFQNVSHTGWIALSMYSPVNGGNLHFSLLAPIPRFDEDFVKRVSDGGVKRLREIIL